MTDWETIVLIAGAAFLLGRLFGRKERATEMGLLRGTIDGLKASKTALESRLQADRDALAKAAADLQAAQQAAAGLDPSELSELTDVSREIAALVPPPAG